MARFTIVAQLAQGMMSRSCLNPSALVHGALRRWRPIPSERGRNA